MIRIEPIRIAEHREAAGRILAANWSETGFAFDLVPDWPTIEGAQAAGLLIALGAFDGQTLVGYSGAIVSPHLFNRSVLVAQTFALFVLAEYRVTGAGARLIARTERVAKERGARFISWHTRAGTPLAAVMASHGYTPADMVVMKEL